MFLFVDGTKYNGGYVNGPKKATVFVVQGQKGFSNHCYNILRQNSIMHLGTRTINPVT